jgi:FtsZ-interacting cell division protein ZipA
VIRAGKLDEFCAAVDIQFVLHIVEASGGVFAGTKLRGVAEAAGLVLEDDGVFRSRDAGGGELFTVANLGAERLEADSIKSLATHGLTLSIDVPRVANGVQAFDRMLATAQQISSALGGVLVDAQRAPLSDMMIGAIRAKTAELQRRMYDGEIAPGGVRALRLFS